MSGVVWSDAARALFDLVGPTAVSAGAGTGKTTCLVELCVRLLSGEATGAPCDPAEIVAITFTEKAAAELVERLRGAVAARLAGARAGSDEASAWRRRLDALQHMAVGTIHGFARRLLAERALEAGIDPDLEVLDEETSRAWRLEAARGAVLAALDDGRPEARTLVAAYGPGTRRAGLADVVADLVRERATAGDLAPVLPSPGDPAAADAARAAALRACDALLVAGAEVRSATGRGALHRLAEAMASLTAADRGAPPTAVALARFAALPEALRGWRCGAGDGALRPLRDALEAACGRFALEAAGGLAARQQGEIAALVSDAEGRYARRKRGASAADFDDLLLAARALLRAHPGVRRDVRRRLRALLVDEYQDVNAVQQDLFTALTAPDDAAPGPLLVAVGDLKQSIYRFRGADVGVFREVLQRLGRPGGRVLHLVENHRSSPALLELVNEVFGRCMVPASSGEPRPYELTFGPDDRLVARRPPGLVPACEILEDELDGGTAAERRAREARALAARVQALVSGAAGVEIRGRGEDDGPARRPGHGDVAILFRRLTQVREYERALREAGIPCRLARGGGFYQAPEVRDVGELLSTLAEPDDPTAWAALLRSPLCGLDDGTLLAIAREGWPSLWRRPPDEVVRAAFPPDASPPAPSVTAATAASGEASLSDAAGRLARFLGAWHALRAARDRVPLRELVARAVDALDLEAACLAAPDGERRRANLLKVLAIAEAHEERGGGVLELATRLRELAQLPPREPEADLEACDAVALVSVHQAKGLEWPIVLVADLGARAPSDARRVARAPDGRLATTFYDADVDAHHATAALVAAREEGRRAAAAESRRLLYVAMTRARDRLVLSGRAVRPSGTWRELVEAAAAARPDLVVRIPYAEAATRAVASPAAAPEDGGAAPPPGGEARLGVPSLAALREVRAVRVSVTRLTEHARCPRWVHLARDLGVAEPGRGRTQDDPDRATDRGTLAHAMLAEVDLSASPLERRAQLDGAVGRRGFDPRAPGVRRIMADVMRFLDSGPGQRLAAAARAGALRREVPFTLRLGAPPAVTCYLVGAIDALVEEVDGVAVLDFKYALARPGAAERYHLQLLAYALAASRALPGRRVTASLQFLRGACATVDLSPGRDALARFARDAPRLALGVHAGAELRLAPEQLGKTADACTAAGCGFVTRCHGRRAAITAPPA